jgi:hypothetical protein
MRAAEDLVGMQVVESSREKLQSGETPRWAYSTDRPDPKGDPRR